MPTTEKFTIQENTPLAPMTTFQIGGPARFFCAVKTKEELAAVWQWGKERGTPILLLGGGSNVLIPDSGWPGLAIKLAVDFCEFRGCELSAGAGAPIAFLAYESLKQELTGLEWAGGLPGTLGGAIRGNAGAFRFEIGPMLKKITVFRPSLPTDNPFLNLAPEECGFAYRTSLFKTELKDDIIVSAEINLSPASSEEIRKRWDDFLEHRGQSQPSLPSAGCVFKNFLIGGGDEESTEKLKQSAGLPEKFLEYKKIPAAWLVEKAGMKGARVGGAQVSPCHANFIVNLGGAKAADVLALVKQIKEKVYNEFGIDLEEEMQVVKEIL